MPPRWILSWIGLLALACLVCGCEPASKTTPPEPVPEEDTHPTAPRQTAPAAQEQLRGLIEVAERFARLDIGFSTSSEINAATEVLRGWAATHFDAPRDVIEVGVLGMASGYPALTVAPDGGSEPLPVIVVGEEVLYGPSGFSRFRDLEPDRDPRAWASAWLVLHQGIDREPLDAHTMPPDDPPQWHRGQLRLAYIDDAGDRVRVMVPFTDDGVPGTPETIR